MESVVLDENVFNILVATDIHLGYKEKDQIRGNDSFKTFEEILSLAVERKVEFLLLGGDIFHSKPSQSCLYECITLLKRYCMGDRPPTFKSESSENFRDGPNYKNPNLKISLPVFCIHGNHDLTGRWERGPIDLLDKTGLVNYFGNYCGKEKIDVQPICFQKGSSRLAIFGLGYIRDEYLSKLFRDGKVNIEPKDDHYNVMVLHQNRVQRGSRETSYIKDEYLPPSLDLVIWGHEHDCIPKLEPSSSNKFDILQPGSSVATALSKGEATKKHVFLLKVEGCKLKSVEPIPLLTVRPFVFRVKRGINCLNEISIAKVEECVSKEIEEMIEEAASLPTDELPLIKLKYEHSLKDEEINSWRIGQKFFDKVANPDEMIDFKKGVAANSETAVDAIQQQQEQSFREQLKEYFHQKEQQKDDSCSFKVLCIEDLVDAVNDCVGNQETEPGAKQLEIQIDKLVKNRNIGGDPGDERIDHLYSETKLIGDAPREMDSINMGDERIEDDIQVIQVVSGSHPQSGAGSSGESWYHNDARSKCPLSSSQGGMHSRNSEDVEMEVDVQDKIPYGGSSTKRGKRKAVPSPMKTPQKNNILAYFEKRPSPGSEKQ